MGGSSIGNPRLLLFASGAFRLARVLNSVEGAGCGFVVVLEDGGAGSLLPRAHVSVDADTFAPLRIGLPVVFI